MLYKLRNEKSTPPPPSPHCHSEYYHCISSLWVLWYYTDIDRDGHLIFTFRWTAKRVTFSQGKILSPPTHDISSVPVDFCYIRWSKWMISTYFMCSTTTTKFGNKTRSLRTKQNCTQTWQVARVLLWRSISLTTAYTVHFFLGQFPNMELMLLLSRLFYLLNCYIFVIASLQLLYISFWPAVYARLTTWAS